MLLQYADDTEVAETTCFSKLSYKRIQEYCKQIREYYINWGIQLNEDKTEYLVWKPPLTEHGPKKGQTRTHLTIGRAVIKPAEGVKYLGVHLDSAVNFKKQAMIAKRKASAAIGMARSLLARLQAEQLQSQNTRLLDKMSEIMQKTSGKKGQKVAKRARTNNRFKVLNVEGEEHETTSDNQKTASKKRNVKDMSVPKFEKANRAKEI